MKINDGLTSLKDSSISLLNTLVDDDDNILPVDSKDLIFLDSSISNLILGEEIISIRMQENPMNNLSNNVNSVSMKITSSNEIFVKPRASSFNNYIYKRNEKVSSVSSNSYVPSEFYDSCLSSQEDDFDNIL
jgi:hypothetical protein